MSDGDGTHSVAYYATRSSGAHTDVYHTDLECPMLKKADTIRDGSVQQLQRNRRLCEWCEKGPSHQRGGDNSLYKALKEADPENGFAGVTMPDGDDGE